MDGSESRFDRFEILAPLGAGGMGEVVKARALGPHGFEKVVAIKRIRAEWAAQENMAERFIREARIAARLQHANIVTVFDFGRHGDELFIVMEYIEGQSLDAILHRMSGEGKRPSVAQSLQITLDVARALESAHGLKDADGTPASVIHRDVSPANVLVSRGGVVKLTDFGIAAFARQESRTSLVAGKPLYMAPEQLRGDPLDVRADLFAVGLVLYEMLTGRRPWPGMIDASPDASLESMGYKPPSAWTTGLPKKVDEIVARLLAPRAADRPASARELIKDVLTMSYEEHIVLDSSELVELVGEAADVGTMPTMPHYQSKPETLVARVSPDGITLLATAEPSVASVSATATARDAAPSRRSTAMLVAVGVALIAGLAIGAWAMTGADPDAPPPVAALGAPDGPSEATRGGRRGTEGRGASGAEATDVAEGRSTRSSGADEAATEDPTEAEPVDEAEPTADEGEPVDDGTDEGAPTDEAEGTPTAPSGRTGARAGRRGAVAEAASPTPPPVPSGEGGELDVYARPWAEIYIDGHRQAQNAPARGLRVSAGRHQVRLVNPVLGLAEEHTVQVPAGGRAQLRVVFEGG